MCLNHPNVKMIVNTSDRPDICRGTSARLASSSGTADSKVHTERQVAIGVDVIVAQGTEAADIAANLDHGIGAEVVDAVGPTFPCSRRAALPPRADRWPAAIALGAQREPGLARLALFPKPIPIRSSRKNMLAATSGSPFKGNGQEE